jgi:hypothetical protein
MRKKVKNVVIISILSSIIILILVLLVFNYKNIKQIEQTVYTYPGSQCTMWQNSNATSNSNIYKTVTGDSYTCEAPVGGNCYVTGFLKIDKNPAGNKRVVFRSNNNYGQNTAVAVSLDGGPLVSYGRTNEATLLPCMCSTDPKASCVSYGGTLKYLYSVGGHEVILKDGSDIVVCAYATGGTSKRAYGYKKGTGSADTSSTPVSNCDNIVERCDDSTIYKGEFNFNIAGLTGFPFSTGGEQNILINTNDPSSPVQGKTIEEKLLPGQTVTFQPRYYDGPGGVANSYVANDIKIKNIEVKVEDCTCKNDINALKYCDPNSNNVLCLPTYADCPAGTYLISNTVFCYDSKSQRTNICADSPTYPQKCTDRPIKYNTFKQCTTNKENGCNMWSASTLSYTSPLVCRLSTTNKKPASITDIGLGGKGCDDSSPVIGTTREGDDTSSISDYQIAIPDSNGCGVWSGNNYCLPTNDFKYDIASGKCVVNFVAVNPASAQCDTDKTKIKLATLVTGSLYKIGSPTLCSTYANSEKQCKEGINAYEASCTCTGVNECSPNEEGKAKCVNGNIHQVQYCNYNGPDTCLKYRTAVATPTGQVCVNDQLIIDPNQGCTYGTATCDTNKGLICSSVTNQNDPTYNSCICDASKHVLANYTDFTTGKERCLNNIPQQVKLIGTSSGVPANDCYEWINKQTNACTGDTPKCVVQ